MTTRTQSRNRRGGFTLVELLVVIAIIALLVSLTSAAVFKVIYVQEGSVTKMTLNKLHSELDGQIKQVIDQAKEEFKNGKIHPNLMSQTSVGGNQDKGLELWILLRLRQEFPRTFQEATSNTTDGTVSLPYKPTYYRVITPLSPSGLSTNEEAAVCLVVALSQARRSDPPKLESALGASAMPTITVNNKPIQVAVDAWGTPIKFGYNTSIVGTTPVGEKNMEVISAGPDKQFGTGDDLNSATLRKGL